MKQKLKRLLSVLVFCILVLMIATDLSGLFWSRFQNNWTDPQAYPYEVLFLGSSHMYRAIIPQYLYNEYGVASLSMAAASQTCYHALTTLEDLPNLSQMRAVVLDLYSFLRPYTYSQEFNHGLTTTDPGKIPPEEKQRIYNTVAAAIRQLPEYDLQKYLRILGPKEMELPSATHYFGLFNSHSQLLHLSRHNYLRIDDNYRRNKNYQAESRSLSFEDPYLVDLEDDATVHINVQCREYLEKIIALCQKRHVPLILTAMPYDVNNSERIVLDEIATIAQENDVVYLSMEDLVYESSFLWESDLMDMGHLNTEGAQKISDFFGWYLTENYELTDHREENRPNNPFLENTYGYLSAATILSLFQDELSATEYLERLLMLDDSYLLLLSTGRDRGRGLTDEQRVVMRDLGFDVPEGECDFSLMQINAGRTPLHVSTASDAMLYANVDAHSLSLDSSDGVICVDMDVESYNNGCTKLVLIDRCSQTVCGSVAFGDANDPEKLYR